MVVAASIAWGAVFLQLEFGFGLGGSHFARVQNSDQCLRGVKKKMWKANEKPT